MKRVNKNLLMIVWITLGIFGAFIAGGAAALFYIETDNFTNSQRAYIGGVYSGAEFLAIKQEIERQPNPTAGEESLLRRPHDRCIRRYYPKDQLGLAGCLDAVNGVGYHMP